jgi:hypothetical protein
MNGSAKALEKLERLAREASSGARAPKSAAKSPSPKAPSSGTKRRPAPVIPQDLLDMTVSREDLKGWFTTIGKASDLHEYGYQVVYWYNPRDKVLINEYVPQPGLKRAKQEPGARVTVTQIEDLRRFHKAIGAPVPEARTEPRERRETRMAASGVLPRTSPPRSAAFARDLVVGLGREKASAFALERATTSGLAFWVEVYAFTLVGDGHG